MALGSQSRRRPLVAMLVVALGSFAVAGCGGSGSAPEQTEIPLCSGAAAAPVPPVMSPSQIGGPLPPVPIPVAAGCARGQGHDIVAAPFFRCTRKMGTSETQAGPSASTNLDRVEVHRGTAGLCVELQGSAIDSFTIDGEPNMVLRIDFRPRGTSTGIDDPTHDYQVTLWSLDAGQVYWLTLYPPHGQALETAVGNVGVAQGNVSLIVSRPQLPNWVLVHGTAWDARLI